MSEYLIEKAANLFDKKKPFVLYRKPHEDQLHLIAQHDAVLHRLDDYTNSGFLLAPFDSAQTPFIIKADQSQSAQIISQDQPDMSKPAEMVEDDEARQEYLDLVNQAIDDIKKGVLDKVVVSRRISVACDSLPFEAFEWTGGV